MQYLRFSKRRPYLYPTPGAAMQLHERSRNLHTTRRHSHVMKETNGYSPITHLAVSEYVQDDDGLR